MMILGCPNCDSKFKIKAEALGDKGRLVQCAKCQHTWHATKDMDQSSAGNIKTAPAPTTEPTSSPSADANPESAPQAVQTGEKTEKSDSAFESVIDSSLDFLENETPDDTPEKVENDYPPIDTDRRENMDIISGFAAPSEPPPIPPDFNAEPNIRTKTRSPLMAWLVLFSLMIIVGFTVFFMRKDIVNAYPPAQKIFQAVGLGVDILGHGLKIIDPVPTREVNGEDTILVLKGELENTTGDIITVPLLMGILRDAQQKELYRWSFKTNERMILPGEKIGYETRIPNPPRGAIELNISFITEKEAEEMFSGDGEKAKSATSAGETSQ